MFRGLFVFLWNGLSFNFSIIYIIYYGETNRRLGDWEQCAAPRNCSEVCSRRMSLRTPSPSKAIPQSGAQMYTAVFSYRNKQRSNAQPLSKLEFYKSICSTTLHRVSHSAKFPLSFSFLLSGNWVCPWPENSAAGTWGFVLTQSEILKLLFILSSDSITRPRILPCSVFWNPPGFSAPRFHHPEKEGPWMEAHPPALLTPKLFCESSSWGCDGPGCCSYLSKRNFCYQ